MNNGIYAAGTGLLARTQELDLAANNLANAGTTGYRGERVNFQSQLMSAANNISSRGVATFGVLGSGSVASGFSHARDSPRGVCWKNQSRW